MQPIPKAWKLWPQNAQANEALAASARISPVLAQILINRGVSETADARRFIDSPLTGLHAPELLPGAVEAADRLWAACQAKRRICVYGDYDVDGTSGTAILWQVLTILGAKVEYYLPKRLEEGYGLNSGALRALKATDVDVVVSVDCGITSLAEADEAINLGLELIVTDHHQFQDQLPNAAVIVHPFVGSSPYPFGGLSGAGVAFKVAWLVAQRASGGPKVGDRAREVLLDSVAMAALGLVADVMPLVGENRVLVRHGLHRMKVSPTPGLRALIASAGLTEVAAIHAEDIGFRLAPRLNAAGRMGCARLVVELLTTPSEHRAKELAAFLEDQNQKRQQIERKITTQARDLLAAQERDNAPAIVLACADWHPGVIGIVAGRLAEQFGKPTLLMAMSDGIATGSGRSITGFALHEALAGCSDILIAHGGHAAAAGFRLNANNLNQFRERFLEQVAKYYPQGAPTPVLQIDGEVPLSALTPNLVRELERLEPYGCGNPKPRFLAAGLSVVGEPKAMGQGERHLSMRVRQGQTTLRAVAWNMAERTEELLSGDGACSLVFVPRINEWNGFTSVELNVLDFQPNEQASLA